MIKPLQSVPLKMQLQTWQTVRGGYRCGGLHQRRVLECNLKTPCGSLMGEEQSPESP